LAQIDDATYRAQALFGHRLAVGSDGFIYEPTAGDSLDLQVPITRCPLGC
jgi:hypothetical protein